MLRLAGVGRDAELLAAFLLERFGSIPRVMSTDRESLKSASGLSDTTLLRLKALRNVSVAMFSEPLPVGAVINGWESLTKYLLVSNTGISREQFHVIYLDMNNRVIANVLHAFGTVNHVAIYPREIMKIALERHATGIILVHNHPSGDPKPSLDDIALTKEIARVGETLGVTLIDHVIVCGDKAVGMRQLGLL